MIHPRIDAIKDSLDELACVCERHGDAMSDELKNSRDRIAQKDQEVKTLRGELNSMKIEVKKLHKRSSTKMLVGFLVGVILSCFMFFIFSLNAVAQDNHYDPDGSIKQRVKANKGHHQIFRSMREHGRKKFHNNNRQDKLQPVVTAIDYSSRMIHFMNYESDQLISVDPLNIPGWPGNVPLQHTAISADAKTAWISTDATVNDPPRIIILQIKDLDWDAGEARIRVKKEVIAGSTGEPSSLPFVEPVNDVQNVPGWIMPAMTQVHGFTFLPFSNYMYSTEYPTDKVHVLNIKNNKLKDSFNIEGWTEQTHGIVFNKAGTIGLGTGYFFDNNLIDVYKPNRITGELSPQGQIPLTMTGPNGENLTAAMTHLVYWIDNRYAVTATMQLDKTSATSADIDAIIPPSVWLIDSVDMTATKIIDKATSASDSGVFRSASDVAVVNNKLYIAEEDSLGYDFAQDGYISVFDISDRYNPVFLKRLMPGADLPTGYAIAHTFSPTVDNRFVIVGSWMSGYVLKIDTYDDTVAHVWGPGDGLVMPHGVFAAGGLR